MAKEGRHMSYRIVNGVKCYTVEFFPYRKWNLRKVGYGLSSIFITSMESEDEYLSIPNMIKGPTVIRYHTMSKAIVLS